jgi:hypothetical protein
MFAQEAIRLAEMYVKGVLQCAEALPARVGHAGPVTALNLPRAFR